MSFFTNSNFTTTSYIPDFKLNNNKNQNLKDNTKDQQYKYVYLNIDSRYRNKNPNYELSSYYNLDSNPLIIKPESNEIKIKLTNQILNEFKDNETITIENIQPIQKFDYFDNIFSLSKGSTNLYFKNLEDSLKFSNTENLYLCSLTFENVDSQFLNEYSLNFSNYKIIHKNENNEYSITLSDQDVSIIENYNVKELKFKVLFFYIYNIPFNEINANTQINELNNKAYRTVNLDNEYYVFNTTTYSNLKQDEENEEETTFEFGGNNVKIRKINNIDNYYQNSNFYNYQFNETIKNIEDIKIINSAFPCYINNITSKNNKLYFKIYNNEIIYSISLNTGYYTDKSLIQTIETKIKEIQTFISDIYYNSIVDINEELNNFSFELFKCKTANVLKIDSVYFMKTDKQLLECKNFEDIKNYSELEEGNILITMDNFAFLEDNQIITFTTENQYIPVYIFGTVLYIPSKFLKSVNSLVNENNHKLFIVCDFLKDYEQLLILNQDIKPEDKINLSFDIQVPVKFSLMFNYFDTFGSLLGFQNIGEKSAFTNFDYKITNQTNYFNQTTNLNNHINLMPYKYIYCVCDKIQNLKSKIKFVNDQENTNIFAIFYIYKQKSCDNYIYDSFSQNQNSLNRYNYLNNLTFYFYDPDGNLIDFQNLEHSFILEFKCKT